MNRPATRTVEVNGRPCRIWESGKGAPIYWLPSHPLSLNWSPFHDEVSARTRLVCCSLPGFGGSEGHDAIDTPLDWALAARDLLVAAGFRAGDTLAASSAAAAVAADVAAIWPDLVGRLVLIAPFGLFDPDEPTRDMFAVRAKEAPGLLCVREEAYAVQMQAPEGVEAIEWSIVVNRANETSARILWPFGDTRLSQRIHRIKAPVTLVWGENDRMVPPSYAAKFQSALDAESSIVVVADAGHLAELDKPGEVAEAVVA